MSINTCTSFTPAILRQEIYNTDTLSQKDQVFLRMYRIVNFITSNHIDNMHCTCVGAMLRNTRYALRHCFWLKGYRTFGDNLSILFPKILSQFRWMSLHIALWISWYDVCAPNEMHNLILTGRITTGSRFASPVKVIVPECTESRTHQGTVSLKSMPEILNTIFVEHFG